MIFYVDAVMGKRCLVLVFGVEGVRCESRGGVGRVENFVGKCRDM